MDLCPVCIPSASREGSDFGACELVCSSTARQCHSQWIRRLPEGVKKACRDGRASSTTVRRAIARINVLPAPGRP